MAAKCLESCDQNTSDPSLSPADMNDTIRLMDFIHDIDMTLANPSPEHYGAKRARSTSSTTCLSPTLAVRAVTAPPTVCRPQNAARCILNLEDRTTSRKVCFDRSRTTPILARSNLSMNVK